MSTRNIPFLKIKKENHPKLSQICNYGICSMRFKNEFETAVVKEPSLFEPLKVYCISFDILNSDLLHKISFDHILSPTG